MPRTKTNTLPKIFSCAKCGEAYGANPPDDIHTMAMLDPPPEAQVDTLMMKAVPFECQNCQTITTLYWIDRERFRLEQFAQGAKMTPEERKRDMWVRLRCRECGKNGFSRWISIGGANYALTCDTCGSVLGLVKRTKSAVWADWND